MGRDVRHRQAKVRQVRATNFASKLRLSRRASKPKFACHEPIRASLGDGATAIAAVTQYGANNT